MVALWVVAGDKMAIKIFLSFLWSCFWGAFQGLFLDWV